MRKVIIDTDCGSDDAVAIMMVLKSGLVKCLGITTVSGNVDVKQATLNTLETLERCELKDIPPVYIGADRPLIRERVHARNVHGEDGMGDLGLIHPSLKPVDGKHAVDAIIELVEANPNEVELAVIGPATNVALAMMKAPETMKKLKCIWVMGTCGFGPGNTTPVSEFNVYADAEAYKVMMDFGVHVNVGGYDLCVDESSWVEEDCERLLASGSKLAKFAVECNWKLGEFSKAISGVTRINLCDAISLAPMLWSDVIVEARECVSYVSVSPDPTYGQVIFYDGGTLAAMGPGFEFGPYGKKEPDSTVITKIDSVLYKQRLFDILTK